MLILLKRLRPRVLQTKSIALSLFLLSILLQAIYTFIPIATGSVISALENKASREEYSGVLLIFAIVQISMVICDRVYRRIYIYRRDVFENTQVNEGRRQLFSLDNSLIADKGTGRLIAMKNKGITGERTIFFALVQMIYIALLRFVFIMLVVSLNMGRAALALVISGAVAIIFTRLSIPYIKKYRKRYDKAREESNRITTRVIMEHNTVVMNNMQDAELKKGEKALKEAPLWGFRSDMLSNQVYSVLHLCFVVLEIVIYGFLGYQMIVMGSGSIAQVFVITQMIWFLRYPISIVMHEISQRNQQLASYQRRYSFITTPPTIVDGARSFRYKTGEIEFKNISFIYPEKNTSSKQPKPEITPHPIFDGLSLTIPAGKTTALVGHSGSGKSTLVKLLLRMYDPKKGKIIVDGQPLKSLKRSSLYSHLGYVSQEPAVFDGTIRENLEYGIQNKHKSDEDFWNVLETVRLAEIIRSKPKGLETQLGERGIKLSGGERQRLALARLILRDPEIIILDEPTSALDSVSESAITSVLTSRMQTKTIIVIAHRLQTVMHADQIIVLESGKIIQQGTHTQLLKQKGVYKTLVDLQKGEVKE